MEVGLGKTILQHLSTIMAYDQFTAERIDRYLNDRNVDFYPKKMFSGLCYMVDEKMCCGIHFDKKKQTDLLMARIG